MSNKKPSIDTEIEEMSLSEIGNFNRIVLEAVNKEKFEISLYDGDSYKGGGSYDVSKQFMEVRNRWAYGCRYQVRDGQPLYQYVSNWRGGECGNLGGSGREKLELFMKQLDKVVEKVNFNTSERAIGSAENDSQYKINVIGDSVSFYALDENGNKKGSYLEATGDHFEFENCSKDGKVKSSYKDGEYTLYNEDGTSVSYYNSGHIYRRTKEDENGKTTITIKDGNTMEIATDDSKTSVYFTTEAAIKAGEEPDFMVTANDPLIIKTNKDGSKENLSEHQGNPKGLLYAAIEKGDDNAAFEIIGRIVEHPLGEPEHRKDEVGSVVNRNDLESVKVMALENGSIAIVGMYSDFFKEASSFHFNTSKYYGLSRVTINSEVMDSDTKVKGIKPNSTGHSRMDYGRPDMVVSEEDGKISVKLLNGKEEIESISFSGKLADKDYIAARSDRTQNNHPEMIELARDIVDEVEKLYKPLKGRVKDMAEKIATAYHKDEAENTTTNQQNIIQSFLRGKGPQEM